MMARSGNKDGIEHVRKMFTEFTENLITRVNFLNPFFIHVTPQLYITSTVEKS